ncbi:7-deoxyloganetic acid glucosyl transferase-like [Primulina huaijiensis]|uniref:7-deoxyloganetic acid glucosyl transferase-like n=1 Tax=Primulina huaijiensis TaxID=1492673 RepID=UPI003CC75773
MNIGSLPSHVLIFPFPVQSHVNVMLNLAEIFTISGFQVTFLIPEHIEKGPRFSNIHARFALYPSFHFKTISDGLPSDHPRTGERVKDLFESIDIKTKPQFRDLLESGESTSNGMGPLTCIIADGIMSFTIDIAKDFKIPTILFRPFSASCFWTLFCVPKLVEAGELPIKGDIDMDMAVASIPGMNGVLRLRDLPSFCRVEDVTDPQLQHVVSETHRATSAYGLILNTFQDLEESAVTQIHSEIPRLYTIGPLHAYLKHARTSHQRISLAKEDTECLLWLDAQPLKSVIFVSFGNMTVLKWLQFVEFWHGLVNSGKPFLWVIPDNLIEGGRQILVGFMEGSEHRGKVVDWAPQEEVLSHPAIGCFLTHSGWNSTLESVYESVPMICWPFYADQQVNSRLVGEVWKIGLDMKDICDRGIVAKMVREVMEKRRDEFIKSAQEMALLARKSLGEGGSSCTNLVRLIEDIKLMNEPKSS